MKKALQPGAIGIFDSGYGGLTILSEIQKLLPNYDYIYLGDNSRAPYGSRSFDIVYEFTKQAVLALFDKGCNLVIVACNTASAKALRTIQQCDLPDVGSEKRVLGIIRPTAEVVGDITKSRHIGIVGTTGTIQSGSYILEIKKLYPDIIINSHACPMWVPLVENRESDKPGADYFIKKDLEAILSTDDLIDTIVLGCTHYPLLYNKIKEYTPKHISIITQGKYIASSLQNYLIRHPEMDEICTKKRMRTYYTTESAEKFSETATLFLNEDVFVERICLE